MNRDQLTISKFEKALADTPEASPVELLTQVLAATKSAPAGAGGATAARILDHLRANPGGGTVKEIAEAVGCSLGRVYEVQRAEGSPVKVVKGEGKTAARFVIDSSLDTPAEPEPAPEAEAEAEAAPAKPKRQRRKSS